MANTLSNTGIVTGQTVEALQVSQSVDAFTGANDYDITISGSLTLTGSLLQTGSVYFKQLVDVPATASSQLGAVMIDVDGRLYSGSSSVGSQGTTGEKGENGSQGTTGEKGVDGTQGTTGTQGTVGTTGAAGSQGITGEKGAEGTQGTDGVKGSTGEKGTFGEKGEAGAAGAKGEAGEKGVGGEKGDDGTQGTTGEKGENGPTGPQGTTGTQGTTGEKGSEGVGSSGGDVFNPQVRYLVDSDGDNYQLYATSTSNMLLFDWTRSSTTLTITRSAHGLSNGDKVVVRNVNESYVIGTVASAATNTFTVTVADSGATSGDAGQYGTLFTGVVTSTAGDTTAIVMSAPGGADAASQLNALSLFTGNQESGLSITVPAGFIEGAGGYSDKQDINLVSADAKSMDGTGQSGALTAGLTYNLGANFNRIDVSNIDNFSPINLSLRF